MCAKLKYCMTLFIFIISFIPAITFLDSCDKIRNIQWVYYDITGCSAPWGYVTWTTESETIKIVEEYFKQKNVRIYKIKITNDGTPQACKACYCKTGQRINCKVKDDDVSVMIAEGFYEE